MFILYFYFLKLYSQSLTVNDIFLRGPKDGEQNS